MAHTHARVMPYDDRSALPKGPNLPKPFPGDVTVTFGQAFDVPVIPTGN